MKRKLLWSRLKKKVSPRGQNKHLFFNFILGLSFSIVFQLPEMVVDNCDVMEGETLAIIKDLNILAEEQEQTVQDINKQLRDLKKADRHNYKELLNLINPNQDITFATPSGISEEHRLAIVNRLETAAMRQQLKTMVQESLTEFIV